MRRNYILIGAAAGLLAVGLAVYFFVTSRSNAPERGTDEEEVERIPERLPNQPVYDTETRGTIASIITDQVAYDGPTLIAVREESGAQAVIAVYSMGFNLCAAKDNIVDVSTLAVGDMVEAGGAISTDGLIIPCESAGHYLRVVAQ